MGCAQHALLLQPPAAAEAAEAASAIKSLCLSVPPPPPLLPLFARILCDNILLQGCGQACDMRNFHVTSSCCCCSPSTPLSGVFQANYTITTTRQACFLDGRSRGEGGACRTSKCHEKCMSCCCCRCCCSSKCRQRLIISNWVNGSSISSASGSVLCAGGVGVAPCVR